MAANIIFLATYLVQAIGRLAGFRVDAVQQFHRERISVLSVFAGLLSNLVSNVPEVLVFKPFMAHLSDPAIERFCERFALL